MSLGTNVTAKGGDPDVLESFPQEWIARQVAWERRLEVLARRAEAALEQTAGTTATPERVTCTPEGLAAPPARSMTVASLTNDEVPHSSVPGARGRAGYGVLHRLFGRHRSVADSGHPGRRTRQDIAA